VTQIQIFRRPTASLREHSIFRFPYHLNKYCHRTYIQKHGFFKHPHAHRRRDRRRPLLHPRQRGLRLASNSRRAGAKIQPRTKRNRRSGSGCRERQWSAALLCCERTCRYVKSALESQEEEEEEENNWRRRQTRNQSLTTIPTSRPFPNHNCLLHHAFLRRRLDLTNLNLPEPPQRSRQHTPTLGRSQRPPTRRQAACERWRRHVGQKRSRTPCDVRSRARRQGRCCAILA
jgi:hypothetical protein